MTDWIQRARELSGGRANSANSAIRYVEGPIGTNGTNGRAGIPPAILSALDNLPSLRRPLVARADAWAQIVEDARSLICGEWAASALALGWTPLDLWGVSSDRESLAVWLRGRKLILLDAKSAIVEDGPTARAQFTRDTDGMAGGRLLWTLK